MTTDATPRPADAVPLLNLPNQLTLARLGLAVVLFVLIALELWPAALAVFAVAALTDWLDGYLARRWNLGTAFGRNLDPLVDKVLTCGAFTFLIPVAHAGIAAWMVVVVVTRELIVTGLRSFVEKAGVKFGAAWPGKLKMVLQCAALVAIFLDLWGRSPQWSSWTGTVWPAGLTVVRDVLIYAMVVSTIISGLQYLARATVLLREG
jgi:CDP-diacylglycerol--glycerol-3-phosphate 3-phosphatidyltransferase